MTISVFGIPISSEEAEKELERANRMIFQEGRPYIPSQGAAGRIMGEIGKDVFGPSEMTSTQAPWGPQQPYLKDIFGQAQQLYQAGAPLTPEMSPLTQQYLDLLPGQVLAAQQLLEGPAGELLKGTARGEFLGSNPYLEQMYGQGVEKVGRAFREQTLPSINQLFGTSTGAFGSGAHQALLGQAQRGLGETLSGLYTDIYAPAYEAERGRQQQAALGLGGLGIGAAQTGLGALGQLGAAGQIPEQFQREQAMDPWRQLGLYQGAVTGQYGGTTTAPGPSKFERGLGIASDIAGIFSPFYMPSPTMPSPGGLPAGSPVGGGYGGDPYQYAYGGPYSQMYGGY